MSDRGDEHVKTKVPEGAPCPPERYTRRALIALEDGTTFSGWSFAAEGERTGELVFNTSMTGYQEILTDPSYCGQIVTMTYPLIGNYGVNEEDVESARPQVEGFVVSECCQVPSNWRGRLSLPEYLTRHGIIGIEGVDTRAVTRHIRVHGAMKAAISTVDLDADSLVQKARAWPGLVGRDLVKQVTCEREHAWRAASAAAAGQHTFLADPDVAFPYREEAPRKFRVVAVDCGIKRNILRALVAHGCEVTVVPASISADRVLALEPDGLFVSNGPGDPEGVTYVIELLRRLLDKLPIFGICLGHQMLGLAVGGSTYKLKFGHRGANHPVMNLETGRVEITAQNHGFAVDAKSVEKAGMKISHVNLNDDTVEGMRHPELPVFSVQYHPEASPGPHDSHYLFRQFIADMAAAARR